eukprot:CAMPEP_0202900384 /NCGR_PEP_ID=MMETSP1392-20130828/11418_1 /ASSEMBLY_ACC=CAM_ASM_000868 /TAXON_ID=225041 /ORGANISM="Chlamydomonas chlamydogama, Strain SAG 11-48b" /LENGTH=197 /DNA_ID=CAMNT_0049586763 /DNA_START=577 /DNA_END=1172 /DNA_ORIENTATION=-
MAPAKAVMLGMLGWTCSAAVVQRPVSWLMRMQGGLPGPSPAHQLKAVSDSPTCEVIRAQLNSHLITNNNLDAVLPDLAGQVSHHTDSVLELQLEHAIAKIFCHIAVDVYYFLTFFLEALGGGAPAWLATIGAAANDTTLPRWPCCPDAEPAANDVGCHEPRDTAEPAETGPIALESLCWCARLVGLAAQRWSSIPLV